MIPARAEKVIILGALSAMAEATARLFAAEAASLVLVARDEPRLNELATDLRARGAAHVHVEVCDLAAELNPEEKLASWVGKLQGLGALLIAYGVLTDQEKAQQSLQETGRSIDVNFKSAAMWAQAAATIVETQRNGSIVVIGSVAGDRGRQSNYVYGAAKAGLAAFTQGLAHRLSKVGGRAVLIKPGFVDSPMTAGLKKGGPLWATPDQVAIIIHKAATKGGPIVYAPWVWRFIMLIIRAVPAFIFHKTKL